MKVRIYWESIRKYTIYHAPSRKSSLLHSSYFEPGYSLHFIIFLLLTILALDTQALLGRINAALLAVLCNLLGQSIPLAGGQVHDIVYNLAQLLTILG